MIGSTIDLDQRPRGCIDWLTIGPEEWPDDSGVVRGARPTTDADRDIIREQHIARMVESQRSLVHSY